MFTPGKFIGNFLLFSFIEFCRRLHRGHGRRILPGQKIHASVLFFPEYEPRAKLPKEYPSIKTVREARLESYEHIFELDLYGRLSVRQLIIVASQTSSDAKAVDRLVVLSHTSTLTL